MHRLRFVHRSGPLASLPVLGATKPASKTTKDAPRRR